MGLLLLESSRERRILRAVTHQDGETGPNWSHRSGQLRACTAKIVTTVLFGEPAQSPIWMEWTLVEIPGDLVAAVAERRVIPFVGAGFSASVGLPDWSQLLSRLASETEGSLPYEDLKRYTGDDNLQIAEYLYLKSDRRIGPLRHVIERGLPSHADPTASTAHIELINLGAPQIYTTNYDDLIESTFRAVNLPVNVVALGRDVAVVGSQVTQVVKYHGDLRHESTLVLTESSYFRRLDFESAMDVKFRADLLGRSVLFMGYSFRDINIRLIWFKLNQMMEDIPTADRRQSYIVRLEPNPVLDELYEAVGLRTIVLDPQVGGREAPLSHLDPLLARRREQEVTSLGAFLAELANQAAGKSGVIPGSDRRLFASAQLIEKAERECERIEKRNGQGAAMAMYGRRLSWLKLFERAAPPPLVSRIDAFARRLLKLPLVDIELLAILIKKLQAEGPSQILTGAIARALVRLHQGFFDNPDVASKIVADPEINWNVIWSAPLPKDECEALLGKLETEIKWNAAGNADADVIFAAYLAKRMLHGGLLPSQELELRNRAEILIREAEAVYPAIKDIVVDDGPPRVEHAIAQMLARRKLFPKEDHQFIFEEEDDETLR